MAQSPLPTKDAFLSLPLTAVAYVAVLGGRRQ